MTLWERDLPATALASMRVFYRYVMAMAFNRLADARREQQAQRRAVGREVALEHAGAVASTEGPADAALAERDALEQRVQALPRLYRVIAGRLLAGWSHAEMVEWLGVSERTIGRVVSQLTRSPGGAMTNWPS